MSYPAVFYVKLQLHFGGDIHEISVPAYGGSEPTVTDLMNVIERDFHVPRVLQNLVFNGQELHSRIYEPLSHFGIKNGGTIRLVGRMAPSDRIQHINAHYNTYSYQQPNTIVTYHTNEQSLPYYHQQYQYPQQSTVGTQYDVLSNKNQSPSTPHTGQPSERSNSEIQKSPATPNSSNIK